MRRRQHGLEMGRKRVESKELLMKGRVECNTYKRLLRNNSANLENVGACLYCRLD